MLRTDAARPPPPGGHEIRRHRRRRRLLRRHGGVGRGTARLVGRDHRQGRLRRRHFVQQPQDAARRPAIAAARSTSRRCGCSSASGARWRGSCRTWCARCRSWCRRRAIRCGARWRCGSLLAVNDAVARDRNRGPAPIRARTCPPAGSSPARKRCGSIPWSSPEGVTGGAVWYDYQMHSTDRVTLSFLLSAVDAGACAANYVQANRFLQENGRVTGVKVEDRLTGDTFAIRGSVVVNAAGPWAAALLADLPAAAQGAPPPRLSRAMNVITRKVVERSRLRRAGQRPLPVHDAVARRLDARHQPRRARRHRRSAEGLALGPRGVPEGRARGVPPCRPDRRATCG